MPNWKQLAAAQPLDPYAYWGMQTGFLDLFGIQQAPKKTKKKQKAKQKWFPVILELADGVDLQAFARRKGLPRNLAAAIRVPSIYANPPESLKGASFCTARVKAPFFDLLGSEDAATIARAELGLPLSADPKPTKWSALEKVESNAEVVTGIIDDGLAFAHERFRLQDGRTRIQFFWNQDGEPFVPPSGFDIGWELTKLGGGGVSGIDKLLADASFAGMVDEDKIYTYDQRRHTDYRRPGHKPAAWRSSHGAHVMDLAAGYAPSENRDDRAVIGVQLPVATTANTSGAKLTPYVLDGLWYILTRADLLSSGPLPVVVNLSYGFFAGPHNGSSVLEAAIDELIKLREASVKKPLRVVVPAGNSRLERCHAVLTPKAGAKEPETLAWRIHPEDLTPSFTEMWLPEDKGQSAVVTLTVTTPTGDTTPQPIQAGEEWVWEDGGEVLCKVIYFNTIAPGRTRNMIFIAVAPTATLHPTRKRAPSGLWKIAINNAGDTDVSAENPVHAWIQRDDTPYGYPRRGRQSRFEDALYERFHPATGREVEADNASAVQRDATINAMATGTETIVIGGFRRSDWKITKYSAGGLVVQSARQGHSPDGPDAMAITDDSVAHRGILAAGTRTGSTVQLSGTSVGAPQFTRWVADEVATPGNSGTRQDVADAVNVKPPPAGAFNETNPPGYAPPLIPLPPPSDKRHGAGRMEFPYAVPVRQTRYEK